ncbi:unnamed protein product [Merluccius merluccius]
MGGQSSARRWPLIGHRAVGICIDMPPSRGAGRDQQRGVLWGRRLCCNEVLTVATLCSKVKEVEVEEGEVDEEERKEEELQAGY